MLSIMQNVSLQPATQQCCIEDVHVVDKILVMTKYLVYLS